jgi:general secretion pathway protein G
MHNCQTVKCGARGFTLLEIMVAITILGLITAVTGVALIHALEEARVKVTIESIRSCEDALKLYLLKHNRYPDSREGLQALVSDGQLQKPARDGWGNELGYSLAKGTYAIVSYGSDGAPGGDGYAKDLSDKDIP